MKFIPAIILISTFWSCTSGNTWVHGIVLDKDTKQPLDNVEMKWLGNLESGFKIKNDGHFGCEINRKCYDQGLDFSFAKQGYLSGKQRLTGGTDSVYLLRNK